MNQPVVKSAVYHGASCLGEAEVFPTRNHLHFQFPNNEIRITHFSPPSERCPPLSILHVVSPFSIRCKVQSKSATDQSPIYRLYLSCFQEQKTAVVVSGDEELHLVSMPTKADRPPCFWCCSVPAGLYSSCLGMLNLRCLAIVFDLDETLVVANTMKSFGERIRNLTQRIDAENDPIRVSGMSAELKRCLEDKALLKQYTENDNVLDNGRLLSAQNEEVPPHSDSRVPIIRPVIRLQERNIVFTRINPEIRDTSVLVRLRPAWEDLRSYLTAKGRKRFEVYVCTMAEREYALEMWRLLDPEAHLISPRQLLNHVVCVKSGTRKSLANVFQGRNCHPKMSMVIDDRLDVWVDKDQPRVLVVPAFTPYYAPQAEAATAIPLLHVARNIACNVRGGFFKEFDENLLRRIFELYYEDDILHLPPSPDVSNFLMSEDTGTTLNVSRDTLVPEGMTGSEVERRLNPANLVDVAQSTQCSLPACDSNDLHVEAGSLSFPPSSLFIGVLHEIGRRCQSKVEFRSIVSSNSSLQFSCEVLFSGEKIGVGMGKTRKEAELHAAETALCYLANSYVASITPPTGAVGSDMDKLSLGNENGFLWEIANPGSDKVPKRGALSNSTTLGLVDDSSRLSIVVSGIKELCTAKGLSVVFQDQVPSSMTLRKGECYSQVEIAGHVLGKGIGLSKEGAKLQAAEEAFKSLKATTDQQGHKHINSSR